MPYTATNDVSAMDATKPLGTDSPADLDDADRETRLVLKSVVQYAHSNKGGIRRATWKHTITAIMAAPSAGAWDRRPMNLIEDPFGIIPNGAFTNSVAPIAGTYLIEFRGTGFRCDAVQCRIAQATGNTLTPSASSPITGLFSEGARSDNSNSYATVNPSGAAVWTTDGTISLCFDQAVQTASTSSWGNGPALVGAEDTAALVTFTYLGPHAL
jgi:hypothetical protein